MIKRTIYIVRKNPLILVVYLIFMGINILMSELMSRIDELALNPLKIDMAASKMLGIWIIIMVISVLFICGYGNMLSSAIRSGKCTLKDFWSGLDYFLQRILLSTILLFFIVMLFFLMVTIAAFPVLLAVSVGGIKNMGVMAALLTVGTEILAVFVYPCIMLWFPAVFIDDTGVMEGLRKGMNTSKKCYWPLVRAAAAFIIPSTIYAVVTEAMTGSVYGSVHAGVTLGYTISMIISVGLSFFFSAYVFVVYDEKSKMPL